MYNNHKTKYKFKLDLNVCKAKKNIQFSKINVVFVF